MVTNAASTFATSFAAFAAQASLPWVPVAVNGDQVVYSYDEREQRTPPAPYLKLEETPLTAEGMFGDAVAGYEFDVAGTKLVKDWSKLQRTANGLSRFLGKSAAPEEFVTEGLRDKGLWKSMAPEIFGEAEFDFEEIGDANVALGAMILGGKYPTYMTVGVGHLQQSVFKLLAGGKSEMAAMLLELGANTRLSFQNGMEHFGRIAAHAWQNSVETSADPASFDLRLARGIWYGWFDFSGYTLEEFHKASVQRQDSERLPLDLITDNMGMVGARLRRDKLGQNDWLWIWERVGQIGRIMDHGMGSDPKHLIAASDLAAEALKNAERMHDG